MNKKFKGFLKMNTKTVFNKMENIMKNTFKLTLLLSALAIPSAMVAMDQTSAVKVNKKQTLAKLKEVHDNQAKKPIAIRHLGLAKTALSLFSGKISNVRDLDGWSEKEHANVNRAVQIAYQAILANENEKAKHSPLKVSMVDIAARFNRFLKPFWLKYNFVGDHTSAIRHWNTVTFQTADETNAGYVIFSLQAQSKLNLGTATGAFGAAQNDNAAYLAARRGLLNRMTSKSTKQRKALENQEKTQVQYENILNLAYPDRHSESRLTAAVELYVKHYYGKKVTIEKRFDALEAIVDELEKRRMYPNPQTKVLNPWRSEDEGTREYGLAQLKTLKGALEREAKTLSTINRNKVEIARCQTAIERYEKVPTLKLVNLKLSTASSSVPSIKMPTLEQKAAAVAFTNYVDANTPRTPTFSFSQMLKTGPEGAKPGIVTGAVGVLNKTQKQADNLRRQFLGGRRHATKLQALERNIAEKQAFIEQASYVDRHSAKRLTHATKALKKAVKKTDYAKAAAQLVVIADEYTKKHDYASGLGTIDIVNITKRLAGAQFLKDVDNLEVLHKNTLERDVIPKLTRLLLLSAEEEDSATN